MNLVTRLFFSILHKINNLFLVRYDYFSWDQHIND